MCVYHPVLALSIAYTNFRSFSHIFASRTSLYVACTYQSASQPPPVPGGAGPQPGPAPTAHRGGAPGPCGACACPQKKSMNFDFARVHASSHRVLKKQKTPNENPKKIPKTPGALAGDARWVWGGKGGLAPSGRGRHPKRHFVATLPWRVPRYKVQC